MDYLQLIDYLLIFAYLLFLISIGFYLRKRASKNLRSYFLGSNKLPWWAMGISGMASFFDVAGTMLIVSFLYLLGPRGLYIAFRGGAVLVLVFWLLWMGKWHYRSKCMTGAEWMVYRFGDNWEGNFARIISAVAGIILNTALVVYMIKALGMFLSMFLHYSPMQCSFIIIIVATIYAMVSGFYGVIYIDLFQSLFLFIAVIGVTIFAKHIIHETGDLSLIVTKVTGNSNWLSSLPSIRTEMPSGYKDYEPLAMFAFIYLFRNIFTGMATGNDPKYFGARSERECGSLTLLWTNLMMFRWPMMIGFAVLGIYLVNNIFPDQTILEQIPALIKSYISNVTIENWHEIIAGVINSPSNYPSELGESLSNIFGENWGQKLNLVSFHGTVNPEKIVPAVIMFYSPIGMRGFILIVILAASMSTFNTTVNASAALFTRDIYQRFINPKASNKVLITTTYIFIAIMVSIAFISAFTISSVNDIWAWLTMGLGAGIVVPAFLKFYWWRFNGAGFSIGTIIGVISAFILRYFTPHLVEWLQFSIISGITFFASIIATYLTSPTDEKVVYNFYSTTRPFGLWKPFKNKLSPEIRIAMEKEHRNDLKAVPFNLVGQILLFLMPMQLMVGTYKNFFITLPIFIVCVFGMYFFWYSKLPPKL